MAFSLASPLAKFLNGLEILLSKAQVSSVSEEIQVQRFLFFRWSMLVCCRGELCVITFVLCSSHQDWENNASRSVSLSKQLEPVTQLIIQWRKLELK